jgi:hypothetical protein
MPIDAIAYTRGRDDLHRHHQIEGYCENIPAGRIRIGFYIGECRRGGYSVCDGYAGWISSSRIMIMEIPQSPQ